MRASHTSSPRRRSAFTLVELLTVVTILAILIALLLPAFKNGKRLALLAHCQTNMRSFGMGYVSYTIDNVKYVPGPNWRKPGSKGWLYSNLQMDDPEHVKTGQLWPYMYQISLYRCPADETDPSAVPNRPNNSRMITSYCMNGSVIKYGGRYWDSATGVWDTYKYTEFQGNDILFWEADETKSGGWWWDGANFPWEGITDRHISHASVVAADGHTEWLDLNEFYDSVYRDYPYDMSHTPYRTRLWNVPHDPNGR